MNFDAAHDFKNGMKMKSYKEEKDQKVHSWKNFRAPETFDLNSTARNVKQQMMKVDEYAIGVFAFSLLLGNGHKYPVQLADCKLNDDEIFDKLQVELPHAVDKQVEELGQKKISP